MSRLEAHLLLAGTYMVEFWLWLWHLVPGQDPVFA